MPEQNAMIIMTETLHGYLYYKCQLCNSTKPMDEKLAIEHLALSHGVAYGTAHLEVKDPPFRPNPRKPKPGEVQILER